MPLIVPAHRVMLLAASTGALLVTSTPANAATVSRYVAETQRSYDYSFSVRLPAGLRVAVNRNNGSLAFRRGDRTVVRARMCEASSEGDPTGREALRDEAEDARLRLQSVGRGVYKAAREDWIAVKGGSCLRFARRAGASTRLLRSLASRTRANLGRARSSGKSDAAGVALARRTREVARGLQRGVASFTGGVCSGNGLSCTRVTRTGSVALEGAFDNPAEYFYVRVVLPVVPGTAILVRGTSGWVRMEADNCWTGPVPAVELELDEVFKPEDFGLETRSWRLRYGKPQPRPDGTTSVSWRGYWNRGSAVVDGAGRVIAGTIVQRVAPRLAVSVDGTQTFPDTIQQVSPEPVCTRA